MTSQLKQDFIKLHTSLWQIRTDGRFLIYLGIVVIIGIALRLAFLNQPIRYDEAFTYNVFAAHGLREILTNYGQPNNHIFHTLLVYVATSIFGNEPWIIRQPAFIAGILLAPVAYIAARIHYSKEVGLLAAVFIATSSSLIEYSTNARGYELICLFTLLMFVLAKYIKAEDNLVAWLFLSIIAVLGFFTIPIMLYPYGGFMGWLIVSWLVGDVGAQPKGRFLKHFFVSGLLVGSLVALLYLPVILISGLDKLVSNQYVHPENLSHGLETLRDLVFVMWGHWNTDMPLVGSIILLIGFMINMIFHSKISDDKISLALVQIFWCVVVMLLTRRVPPWSRVFLYLLPIYLMWSSAGIVYLLSTVFERRKYFNASVYGAFVLVLAVLLGLNILRTRSVYYSEQTGTLRDGEQIANWLGKHLKAGDAVVTFAPSDAILQYYFDKSRTQVQIYSEHGTERFFERGFIVTNIANKQSAEFILSKVGLLDNVDLSKAKLMQSYPSADIIEVR